jgi:hypothetical protein
MVPIRHQDPRRTMPFQQKARTRQFLQLLNGRIDGRVPIMFLLHLRKKMMKKRLLAKSVPENRK